MKKTLRLGSRGSPLALLQAEEVQKKLFSAHPTLAETTDLQIVPISTGGDWRPEQREQSFRDLGSNKELFTKEIDEALLTGHIDMAVHSMKDVATRLPQAMVITAVLERADPRDAFIGRQAGSLNDLPHGAVVGTASVRRQAQLLAYRPDLRIVPLRGNVETRLAKLKAGQVDATLLALAGLVRLGLQDRASSLIATDLMLPAAAQGAIGVLTRADDDEARDLVRAINVRDAYLCIMTERAFLRKLDGSCQTPIGALAQLDASGQINLEGVVAKTDGTSVVRMHVRGAAAKPDQLGEELGDRIKSAVPPDFFAM